MIPSVPQRTQNTPRRIQARMAVEVFKFSLWVFEHCQSVKNKNAQHDSRPKTKTLGTGRGHARAQTTHVSQPKPTTPPAETVRSTSRNAAAYHTTNRQQQQSKRAQTHSPQVRSRCRRKGRGLVQGRSRCVIGIITKIASRKQRQQRESIDTGEYLYQNFRKRKEKEK